MFNASPRMSPSDAPELTEPYCATASFSSAISSALIERPIRRDFESKLVIIASSLSPTAKRSGLWSSLSRDKSERLIKALNSLSPTETSRPPSFTAVTLQVTVSPRLSLLMPSIGSLSSCLIPRLMRSFSTSISSTTASTS